MTGRATSLIVISACIAALSAGCFSVWRPDRSVAAEHIRPAPLFRDGMVLQRDTRLKIWGHCEASHSVTLEIIGERYQTVADNDGYWEITLNPLPSCGPVTMKIGGENGVIIRDVVIGEVWVAVGDGGLAATLAAAPGGSADARQAEFAPLRFFLPGEPRDNTGFHGQWVRCSPGSAPELPALGFYFGRELFNAMNIPVGVIVIAASGENLESWREGAARQRLLDPVMPYSCRGVVWAHSAPPELERNDEPYHLPELVAAWRRDWREELFFLVAQLPRQGEQFPVPAESGAAGLREAQQLETAGITDAATVVAIDQELTQDRQWSEPAVIGRRLALTVVEKIHGNLFFRGKKLISGGPLFAGMSVDGNKAVLRFDNVGGGLRTVDGKPPRHFAVSGADGRFYWANAAVVGKDSVEIWSGMVAAPAAVRYAWADNPAAGNLCNSEGLPAAPFRTDR